jgi:hypothetical protein
LIPSRVRWLFNVPNIGRRGASTNAMHPYRLRDGFTFCARPGERTSPLRKPGSSWIPAFAGMTEKKPRGFEAQGLTDEMNFLEPTSGREKQGAPWEQRTLSKRGEHQKTNFRPNCIDRAGCAEVISAVTARPIFWFRVSLLGLFKFTWLGMLNISQRNCRYLDSVT